MWAAEGKGFIFIYSYRYKPDLPLIMDTSLAPSPMARVTAFLARLISSTTSAFWRGVTRQQMTALHCEAMSRNLQSTPNYSVIDCLSNISGTPPTWSPIPAKGSAPVSVH